MYLFNPSQSFRIDQSIEPPDEAFESLTAAEKKKWREKVTDYLAAALFSQLSANERDREEYLNMKATERMMAAAEITAKGAALMASNLNNMTDAACFFRKIGASINPLSKCGDPTSYSFSDPAMTLKLMNQDKLTKFRVNFGLACHVALSAPADIMAQIATMHDLPGTLTAVMPDGWQTRIYALPVNVRGPGWRMPTMAIEFSLVWEPSVKWSSPVIDPATGDLPRLPAKAEQFFRMHERSEKGEGLSALFLG